MEPTRRRYGSSCISREIRQRRCWHRAVVVERRRARGHVADGPPLTTVGEVDTLARCRRATSTTPSSRATTAPRKRGSSRSTGSTSTSSPAGASTDPRQVGGQRRCPARDRLRDERHDHRHRRGRALQVLRGAFPAEPRLPARAGELGHLQRQGPRGQDHRHAAQRPPAGAGHPAGERRAARQGHLDHRRRLARRRSCWARSTPTRPTSSTSRSRSRCRASRPGAIRSPTSGCPATGTASSRRTDTIKSQPDLLARFTSASQEGWAYAIANPTEAVTITLDDYPSGQVTRPAEAADEGPDAHARPTRRRRRTDCCGSRQSSCRLPSTRRGSTSGWLKKPLTVADVMTQEILNRAKTVSPV